MARCVRAFADDPHPNLIRFYAFVLTPSYALCVMDFHRRLMPVSLSESHARPYLVQLLSAVAHLHKHGISHNDIKPSNILLSSEDRPILIDFGFAQQYEVGHPNAFISSLSWGTPGPYVPAADLAPHTLTHIRPYRIPESRTGERGGPRRKTQRCLCSRSAPFLSSDHPRCMYLLRTFVTRSLCTRLSSDEP